MSIKEALEREKKSEEGRKCEAGTEKKKARACTGGKKGKEDRRTSSKGDTVGANVRAEEEAGKRSQGIDRQR